MTAVFVQGVMIILRLGIIGALLVLLVACGSTPTSTTTDDPRGAATAPATSTNAAQQSAQPDVMETPPASGDGVPPLAVLTRSGGITGATETLVVLDDGSLQVIEGEVGGQTLKEGRASAEQIAKLRAAVQAQGWQQLDATYGEQVPDGYAYTIVANSKTITTYDGAQYPPQVENVLTLLNELWP